MKILLTLISPLRVMISSILLVLATSFMPLKAQTTLFSFEEGTFDSDYWSASNSVVSLSKEHVREGFRSLKWELASGAKIVLDYSKKFPGMELSYNKVVYIPIYCLKPGNDKLIISFYKDSQKVCEGRQDLNYQGWLPFQRYIYKDFGKDVMQNFNRIEITYEPSKADNTQTLWIDGVCTSASYSGATSLNNFYICQMGPQMITDYLAGCFPERSNLNNYFMEAFSRTMGTKDVIPVTDENKNQVDAILSAYKSISVKSYESKLTEATNFVFDRNIQELPDGGINANASWLVYTPDQAYNCAYYVASLAYAAIDKANAGAKDNLIKLTRYMLDYGISPGGGPVGMLSSNYTACREFAKGFLYAMPVYEDYDSTHSGVNLKKRVIDLLSWCYNYGFIYGKHEPDLVSLDQVHVKSQFYYNLASFYPAVGDRASELKHIARFLEQMTEYQTGKTGVIKPDGLGFHHGAMHNSYMYGFQSWITQAAVLKGTSFHVGLDAYEHVREFVTTHYKQCVTTGTSAFYSNAQCGRGAFNLTAGVNQNGLETLAYIGGDIMGNVYDPQVAALCKLFYPGSRFSDKPADLNGFYQMNYGNMGVFRAAGYTVTMRGLSSDFWGTEIYTNANRFGRYQSYGTTEVLYNRSGGYAASGYPTNNGWDWNVVPGTTTVHSSWKELNPGGQESVSRLPRADEYQSNNFAGSISGGDCGLFALDFKEDPVNSWGGPAYRYNPTGLEFKKTVFACDSLLICLGSNIKFASNLGKVVATNLFQNIISSSVGNLFVNNENAISSDLDKDYSFAGNPFWMVTPAGTGYYIPSSSSGTLHVTKGMQSTPNPNIDYNTLPDNFPLISNQVAKAWLAHSPFSEGDKYEFVIAPNKTASQMKQLADQLTNDALYKVLQQNESAHIIQMEKSKTTAYAVFNTQADFTSLGTLVTEVNNPCLLITKETADKSKVSLNVCLPDAMNEQIITVSLKGKWTLNDVPESVVNVDNSLSGSTVISILLKNGLATNLSLSSIVSSLNPLSDGENNPGVIVNRKDRSISVTLSDSQEQFSIELYNSSGIRVPLHENYSNIKNGIVINASHCAGGLYCIRVIGKNGQIYSKKLLL